MQSSIIPAENFRKNPPPQGIAVYSIEDNKFLGNFLEFQQGYRVIIWVPNHLRFAIGSNGKKVKSLHGGMVYFEEI